MTNRSELINDCSVTVRTCETTLLGFCVIEPQFLANCGLPQLDDAIISSITRSVIALPFNIYKRRHDF